MYKNLLYVEDFFIKQLSAKSILLASKIYWLSVRDTSLLNPKPWIIHLACRFLIGLLSRNARQIFNMPAFKPQMENECGKFFLVKKKFCRKK